MKIHIFNFVFAAVSVFSVLAASNVDAACTADSTEGTCKNQENAQHIEEKTNDDVSSMLMKKIRIDTAEVKPDDVKDSSTKVDQSHQLSFLAEPSSMQTQPSDLPKFVQFNSRSPVYRLERQYTDAQVSFVRLQTLLLTVPASDWEPLETMVLPNKFEQTMDSVGISALAAKKALSEFVFKAVKSPVPDTAESHCFRFVLAQPQEADGMGYVLAHDAEKKDVSLVEEEVCNSVKAVCCFQPTPATELLTSIADGQTTRKSYEIVVHRGNGENLTWLVPLQKIATVYERDPHGDDGHVKTILPYARRERVPSDIEGRDVAAYAMHILQQRESSSLSERTLFLHGALPSFGFWRPGWRVHKRMGNHLMRGVSLLDYLLQPIRPQGYLGPLTIRLSTDLECESHRSSFIEPPPTYSSGDIQKQFVEMPEHAPKGEVTDRWLSWQPGPRGWLNASDEFIEFAGRILSPQRYKAMREAGYVSFSQGAQFAVSKDALMQVPVDSLHKILEELNSTEAQWKPRMFYMEFLWRNLLEVSPLPEPSDSRVTCSHDRPANILLDNRGTKDEDELSEDELSGDADDSVLFLDNQGTKDEDELSEGLGAVYGRQKRRRRRRRKKRGANGNETAGDVAVCLTGSLRYADKMEYTGFEHKLLEAFGLPVDIFSYATLTNPKAKQVLTSSPVASLLHDVRFQSVEQSEASLAELPSSFDLNKNLSAASSQSRALAEHYELKKCLELVEDAEAARKRPYRFLVRTRTDFKWLASHPPASLLDESHCWIPQGEDYDGVNDRHAFCGRQPGDSYFRLRDAEISGYFPFTNVEHVLDTHLKNKRVPVGRFAGVAALMSCPTWETHCHSRPLEEREAYGEFKYKLESEQAKSNANLLNGDQDQGGQWIRAQLDRVEISVQPLKSVRI